MKNLTGNIRYRTMKPMFSEPVLVLQVEERHTGTSYSYNGGSCCGKDYDNIYWRDATVQDMTMTKGGT